MLKPNTDIPATPMPTSLEATIELAAASPRKQRLLGFDLRFPPGKLPAADDGELKRFLRRLDAMFGSKGLDLDQRHAWRRGDDGGRPCYRCALLLDGDRLGSVYGAQTIVQERWNRALGLPGEPNYGLVGQSRLGYDGSVTLWDDAPFLEATLKASLAWASA